MGGNTERGWGPYNLTEDYRVVADFYSYTLQKKRVVQAEGATFGNVDWDNEGYYGNVHHLLTKLLSLQLAENLGDMGKALERIEEVEKNLDKLVKIKHEREKSWMT